MSVVSVLSDREALERFKESQPELRTIAQIAAMGEERFVADYAAGSFFAGDVRQARRVYYTAANLNVRNALIWANIKDAVASPYYRSTLFNNIPQEFISHLENLPGYQRLFGSLDFVECDHCRSVFGPAAYFVDLMRFVDEFVSHKDNKKEQAFLLDDDKQNRRRRPDLYTFPLDCHNTHEWMPAIDLVNEVLEAIVRTTDEPDAFKILDQVNFPMTLPFNRPLAEIRDYLGQLGTSLSAIYHAYQRMPAPGAKNLTLHVDRETLGLSPAEYDLIAHEATQPADIERLYGTAYELTHRSLEAIRQANPPVLISDDADKLDALAGRPIPQREAFETLVKKALPKLSDENLGKITDLAFNRYDLQRLSSLPVFLEQTGLDRKQVNELIYQDLDRNEFSAGLSRLFFINNVEDGLGPLMLEDGPDGPAGFDEHLVNLSYTKLDRIHRFLRLARKLGWSFTDLDMALRSLAAPFEPDKMLKLDGIDDYVACRNVTNLDLKTFTVEAWINPAHHGTNIIVAKGQESDGQVHFLFTVNPDGKLAFYYDFGSGRGKPLGSPISGLSVVPSGVFSHVAVAVDAIEVSFYLDGKLDGVTKLNLDRPIRPVGSDLDIGRNLNDEYFEGIVKEVRIWSVARNQSAIAGSRYRRLTGREPGLAGYWPLTENPWNTLFDLTSNRNDGVMGGSEFVTQPTWVQRDLALDAPPQPVARAGYRFNGVDQYLAARHVTGYDMAAVTVEAWVKWDKRLAGGDYEIIAKGAESRGTAQFRLWIDSDGRLNFKSTSLGEFRGRQPLEAGVLTHVAVALPESALGGPKFQVTDALVQAVVGGTDSQGKPVAGWTFKMAAQLAAGRDKNLHANIQAKLDAMKGQVIVGASTFQSSLNTAIGAAMLETGARSDDPNLTPQKLVEKAINTASKTKVDSDTLDALLGPNLPGMIYDQLEALKDREFDSDDEFWATLRKDLGASESAPSQALLLAMAEKRTVRFYVDGVAQQEFELPQAPVVLDAAGDTITLGRKLLPSYHYFQGLLKELRVWSTVRSDEQIAMSMSRVVGNREPGLIGYWRLNALEKGQALDLSSNGNHLFLGGLIEDYAPKRVPVDLLLPPLPIAVNGQALQFDGQTNVLVVQNAENRSLGAYDRMTAAVWFNAADVAADREQIIFAQGDAEDGLVIYVHQGALTVAAWANTYEGTDLQTVVFRSSNIASGKWHHVAVIKDEEMSTDAVARRLVHYTALLDGQSFGQGDASFRLCPVGPLFLGGVGNEAVVWTEALGTHGVVDAAQPGVSHSHHFAGLLTDLRVWKTVKTLQDPAVERYVAPQGIDPDLVVYLPLTASGGNQLQDKSAGGNTAILRSGNAFLAVEGDHPGLEEIDAFYADAAALQWTNYGYSGRLRIGEPDTAIGVTFFSRHSEQKDRCYALKRDGTQRAFVLSAQPGAAQTLRGTLDSVVIPQANTWYRFYVEVESAADRTSIRAKLWPETGAEPAAFQIDAFDASALRLTSGSVGLWTTGGGTRGFDQLQVASIAAGATPAQVLLEQSFDLLAPGQAPSGWQQAGTRVPRKGSNDLFQAIDLPSNTAYGTDLTETGNQSYLGQPGASYWTNYDFSGRMIISEVQGGVGVTFFNRLAAGREQWYVLGRSETGPTFAVGPWPDGLQTLSGVTDTGVAPEVDTWYRFRVVVDSTATETRMRARVWRSGDAEPKTYQIDAVDSSDIRLRSGTIGVWASGSGIKCVDSLLVATVRTSPRDQFTVLYSEAFWEHLAGQKPAGWQDWGAREVLQPIPPAFKARQSQDGVPQWLAVSSYPVLLKPLNRKALAFDGPTTYAAAENVTGLDAAQWTLEAWVKPERTAGGPVFSQKTEPGAAMPQWQLGVNDAGQVALSFARSDGTMETVTAAASLSTAGYSHLAVTVDGARVILYVNGLQDTAVTTPGPIKLSGSSLELGRGADLSAAGAAPRVFAGQIRDLRVWKVVRSGKQIADERYQQPELNADLIGYWPFDEDSGRTTADRSEVNFNLLRLGGLAAARHPLLSDPSPAYSKIGSPKVELPRLADPALDGGLFDPAALKLDGLDDTVDIAIPADHASPLDEATFEAWVKPDAFLGEPTLWRGQNQEFTLAWRKNRLSVDSAGNDPKTQTFAYGFDAGEWTHIAVVYSRGKKTISLAVNGQPVEELAYQTAGALAVSTAQVGQKLRGMIKELRLWSIARTPDEIEATMLRRLTGKEPELLVYRPFNEEASLDHAPAWVGPDLLAESLSPGIMEDVAAERRWAGPPDLWADTRGLGFWRPQRPAATFADAGGLVTWSDAGEVQPEACPRRTVEVWFKADDKNISRRKQVIYHEGDDKRGLVIYLFDGWLYFGGFSMLADKAAWGHWTGTWLKTDRIRSGKWHHAALVLDGRDEMRDAALRAYLDGKFVGEGRGAQLAACSRSLALGGIGGSTRFHDDTTVAIPVPAPKPPAPPPGGDTGPLTPKELDDTAIPFDGNPGNFDPVKPFPFPAQRPGAAGQEITVECWIKPGVADHPGTPISYAASDKNDNAFTFYLYRQHNLTVVINNKRISASGVFALQAHQWQHVAITWRQVDGEIRVYVDGGEVYAGVLSAGQTIDGGGSLTLGEDQDFLGRGFDPYQAFIGKLNEVRFWDTVRTPDQIRDTMNRRLAGDQAGLVAHLPAKQPGQAPDAGAGGGAGQAPGEGKSSANGKEGQVAADTTAEAASFAGQVLELRTWDTARTQRELELYRFRQLAGDDRHLALWWQFEKVDNQQVTDLSGHGLVGRIMVPAVVQTIGALPAFVMSETPLDEDVLARLAIVKRLKEKYQLPMDRLTALWHEIRHTGKEDGRTLFDDTFNPKGSVLEPWPFHMDEPIRWDLSGKTDPIRNRQIRSRLMGALRISHENLNALVATLSGSGETEIELDGNYLTNLYRLARLPGLLRLNLAEFQRQLSLMGLPGVGNLAEFLQVSDRVDWMQRTGIDVFELDFLSNDKESDKVAFPYNDGSIRDLADSLRRQSSEFLAKGPSFVTAEVGELQSRNLVALLRDLGVIDGQGAVDPAYAPPKHFDRLFTLAQAAAGSSVSEQGLNLAQSAYARLSQDQLDELKTHHVVDDNGMVLDGTGKQPLIDGTKADFSDKRLSGFFADADATALSTIREALELGLKIQVDLANKLLRMRDDLANATLLGVSTLAGASPDRTLVVLQHLGDIEAKAALAKQTQAAGAAIRSVTPEQQQLSARLALKQVFDILAGIKKESQQIPDTLTGRPQGILYRLSKILFLAGQFGLTLEETGALVQHPDWFGVKNILRPDLADLTDLYLFSLLKVAFGDKEGKLIKVLAADSQNRAAVVVAIHELTGWESSQIERLMDQFGAELAINRASGLDRLRVIFDIAAAMRVDASFATELANTSDLSYGFYARQAANLWEVLRSRYDDEQWPKVQRSMHDRLATQMRDALLARAMLAISPGFAGRRSPDVLSEYLLLDVQTGSEVDTSRIVQAIASVQLYVQRCMMNLERGINPATVPAKQWEWMKNYRVWEANRKVFLYPENYIEPELRDTKTPFFKELEQDLIQGELTGDLVEVAYRGYLDKFAAVANLKVVGSYYHVEKPEPHGKNTLYLLGRTRTQPSAYYRRELVNGVQWSPWEKIGIAINADFATPVYAFNRLFIFWVEFTKITESRPIKAGPDDKHKDAQGYKLKIDLDALKVREEENVDVFKATVKYSYQTFTKEWIQPQVFTEFGRNLTKDEYIRPEWQRVYLQRSLEFFPSGAPPAQPDSVDRDVQVLQVEAQPASTGKPATELKTPVNPMDMDQLTWSFWVNFIPPLPAATSGTRPDSEAISLVYYDNAFSLLAGDNDFRIQAIGNVTPIAGALENLAAAEQARQSAQTTFDTLKNSTKPAPTQAELAAAQQKLDVADQALRTAKSAPKWHTPNVTLDVRIGNDSVAQTPLAYGSWHHVAVSMSYDHQQGHYSLTLLVDGQIVSGPVVYKTRVFSRGRDVTVGQRKTVPGYFKAQLSEFQLWNRARDEATIKSQLGERHPTSVVVDGVMSIPLDRRQGSEELNLQPSAPGLSLHRKITPPEEPKPRERMLVIWGKDVRKTVRNTLEIDETFNLALEIPSTAPQAYDVDLTLDRLIIRTTAGLSINDYADGSQTTLSRFSPEIRALIISAANSNNMLAPAEVQQFRDRIAALSAFGMMGMDPNNPAMMQAMMPLILLSLGIDASTLAQLAVGDDSTLLKQVSSYEASFSDVNNQPGWYILDTGDEQFLVKLVAADTLKTAEERLKFGYGASAGPGSPQPMTMHFDSDEALEAGPANPLANFKVQFERLSTSVIHQLSLELFAGGISALLSLESQRTPEIDFEGTYQPGKLVVPPNYDRATGAIQTGIDFDGALGGYYREVFFHIPFFIANQLNANQKFADAQTWYHYIFNPTTIEQASKNLIVSDNDRYWRFLPFRNLSLETLRHMLSNRQALDAYRDDPFDPHAIARLRINAYQKAIVMKYIDNLLDWGDNLFGQDTREAIDEASQLYLLAFNLLGERPKSKPIKDYREVGTFEDVLATQSDKLPEFLVELDKRLTELSVTSSALIPNRAILTDFGVIENELFMGYWDRVEDRLFKIRHSLNIEGTFRQLALFQPPINPMELVRQIAGGRDLSSVLADLDVPVPHYRYTYMLERAKDMASMVGDLGSALLEALEKKDAEVLTILQSTHEKAILELTTIIKEQEREAIDHTIEGLNISRESIVDKRDRLERLLQNGGLIAAERAVYAMKSLALVSKTVAGIAKVAAAGGSAIPDIEAGAAGFGGSPTLTVTIGGDQAEGIGDMIAEGFAAAGEIFDGLGEISALAGEHERRYEEWEFEKKIAGHELDEIDTQLAIAHLQLLMAKQQMVIHKRTLEQNQEVADFYRSKFSNESLYSWMVNRLSNLYFQAYKLAYDFAKSAEKALQFELPTTQSYISFGHWDSLKKGLLAGESLLLELNRMEKSHLDQDSRFQEIEKQISMQRSLPRALSELTSSGKADFQLSEALFNRDFPGHYARMIKTIGVSIKTSTDVNPYDSLYATLIQLGNKTLLEPSIDAVRYLMGVDGADQPDTGVLRASWRANQQVAISKIDDEEGDDGMFALDFFFDNRYFPFEGTGAVSAWRLEISKAPENFDRSSITDVIIHLRYTAKYDSGGFKQAVQSEMRNLQNR